MIQKHRLTSDTLIFVSSGHLILRYTHELINEVSLVDQNRFRSSILFGKKISFSREVGSVRSSRSSSTGVHRLHASLSTLFFPETEAYRIGGMRSIFGVRSFSQVSSRTRDVSYTYLAYLVKRILGGFEAKDLLDSPLE